MKNNLRLLCISKHNAWLLFAFIALQFPIIGYCDTVSSWFKDSIESKGKKIKVVSVKVAELHEDKDIEIWGLDFSPDGKYLATRSPTTLDVQIWDWQNKRIVHNLTMVSGAATGLTTEMIRYSPDGHLLVACHSRGADNVVARIWNADTWEIVHDITEPISGGCYAIGFTPDGKSLIGGFIRNPTKPGDNLIIYDTISWQPVWGLRTVPFHPTTLAINPDGKFVAIAGLAYDPAGNETVQISIVDLAQRKLILTIQDYAGHLAWSPDGAYLTAAAGGGVKVFDVHSGKQVVDEPLKSAHMVVRYTPDGKYLLESDMDALGNGLGVRIWDGQHRALLQEIPGNVGSLAVSRDGHYFAAGNFKNISIWQLK